MKPIEFKGCNFTLMSNRPNIKSLKVMKLQDTEGSVISCFELSDEDVTEIVNSRRIYITQQTFNRGFNPIRPGVDLADGLDMTHLD